MGANQHKEKRNKHPQNRASNNSSLRVITPNNNNNNKSNYNNNYNTNINNNTTNNNDNNKNFKEKLEEEANKRRDEELAFKKEMENALPRMIEDAVHARNDAGDAGRRDAFRNAFADAQGREMVDVFGGVFSSCVSELAHTAFTENNMGIVIASLTNVVRFCFDNDAEMQYFLKSGFGMALRKFSERVVVRQFVDFLDSKLLENTHSTFFGSSLKLLCCHKILESHVDYECESLPSDLVMDIKLAGDYKDCFYLLSCLGADKADELECIPEFHDYYQFKLISRLTSGKFNLDNEAKVVSELQKVMNGLGRFSSLIRGFEQNSVYSGSTEGLEFNLVSFPQRLQKSSPTLSVMPELIPAMNTMNQEIARRYEDNILKKGLKIDYQQWSSIQLSLSFLSNSPTIIVNLAQALILRLLSEHDSPLPASRIANLIGVDIKSVYMSIMPLCSDTQKLLTMDPPVFNRLNTFQFVESAIDPNDFNTEVNYFQQVIKLIKEDEELEVNNRRVQARIVFIMKRNIRQTFVQLATDLKEKFPGISDSFIDRQLSDLVNKEYIRIDPQLDDYIYIP